METQASSNPGFAQAKPADEKYDPDKLAKAIIFARDLAETPWPRDLSKGLAASGASEPPPWNEIIGPTKPRTGPNGVILRNGKTLGSWGDVERPDMTFSVAKSYLSILAGIAVADGLIRDLDDTVRSYELDDGYESEQNRTITWRHLLTQTSEWEGELFSKPDLVDRNRQVGHGSDNSKKGTHRDLQLPGSFWEYNDVRVNRLSLSLLQLFGRPLSDVLKERIMDPVCCSDTWEWHGYRNSWVDIGNERLQAVPGGSHWGGGLWISTMDHLRVAELIRRNGEWEGQRLLPADWIETLRTPCAINPEYGLLWWLNTGRSYYPSAPASSFFAVGAGTNLMWIDQDLGIAAVIRWIDQAKIDDFLGRLLASLS
jgi:CubicO group peptidase (beta-lactamase class C family)